MPQSGFTLDPNGVWKGGVGNDYWNLPDKGSITIYGWYGSDTIITGPQPDEVHGQWGNDTLYGNGGYDRLFGEQGNDLLHGGAAADYLSGGSGADRLFGDDGNDNLQGGQGSDFLTGGTGPDAFLWQTQDFAGGKYTDHITDFHAAEADAIHLPSSGNGGVHFTDTASGAVITFGLHDDTIVVDHTTVAQLVGHVFYDLA